MSSPSMLRLGRRLAGWTSGLLLIGVGLATNLVSDQLPEAWGTWIHTHPVWTGIGFVLLAVAAVGLG